MVLLLTLSGLLVFIFFGLLIGCEAGVRRFYSILPIAPQGLSQSLRYALELESVSQVPRILVYQAPAPGAFAVRALWGRGTIFLTQGLICQLSEAELRHTLRIAVAGLQLKRTPLESMCWFMTLLLTRGAPSSWVQLNATGRKLTRSMERNLSPLSAIIFWIFFPFIGFFKGLSEGRRVRYGTDPRALPIRRKMIWSTLLSGLLPGSHSK